LDIDTKKKMNVTKEDIEKGLRTLGLKKGDSVGVHSSLSTLRRKFATGL